jgi:hypothetical protein
MKLNMFPFIDVYGVPFPFRSTSGTPAINPSYTRVAARRSLSSLPPRTLRGSVAAMVLSRY